MSKYCQIYPQNLKPSYSEYDQIDFVLSGDGQRYVDNSLTLCCDVNATFLGDTIPSTDLIKMNNLAGGHGLISSVAVSCVKLGQLEYIAEYPKLVGAISQASLNEKLDTFNSNLVAELRTCSPDVTGALLHGVYSRGKTTDPFRKSPDMALKLNCALNNMIGDPLLPFALTGDLTVTIQLERIVNALYGRLTVGSEYSYNITNVRLNYLTVVDDPKVPYSKNYMFNVYSSIRQSIQSSYSSVTTKAPVVANSVFCSFIQQANEANPMTDNLMQEYLPNVTEVTFQWNGNFSQSVVYTLNNVEEILTNYLEAVTTNPNTNNASLQCIAQNKSYGVGLRFGSPVNLAQNAFTMNIKSSIDGSSPYTVVMHFNGILSI